MSAAQREEDCGTNKACGSKLTFRMKMKRRSVNAFRQKMGPKIGGLFHAKMKHAPPMKLHTGMGHPVGLQFRPTYQYGGEPASK